MVLILPSRYLLRVVEGSVKVSCWRQTPPTLPILGCEEERAQQETEGGSAG